MPIYNFKAKKKDGEEYIESLEAEDKLKLYKEIQRRGDSLISIDESKSKSSKGLGGLLRGKNIVLFSSVKETEKINFANHLSAMLEAGLPVSRALGVLEKQSKKKEMKDVFMSIQTKIKEGGTLSSGLEQFPKIFSKMFVAMVRAGEESGNLEEGLRTIGIQLEKNYSLKKRIRGAMIYPSVILVAMILIAILMLTFIVPTLAGVFEDVGVDLPIQTRAVIWFSDFLMNNVLLVSLASLVFGVAGVLFLKTAVGGRFVDSVIIKLPVIKNIVKEVNAARTARTFSSLLSAGVDVVPALSITEEVIQNSYFKPILREAQERIQKGERLSGVFVENDHLYPVFLGEMMSVGEETGKISDMLVGVAVFFEEEVDQRTKNISTIIEPVLMIFIGVAVGFFAVSMLMPMYSIMSHI